MSLQKQLKKGFWKILALLLPVHSSIKHHSDVYENRMEYIRQSPWLLAES